MADALAKLLSDASHHLSDTVSPTWTESTRVAYYERSHELLLRALEMLRKGQELQKRPVAFRVKDYADGWIILQDESAADREAERTGALVQGLYVRACPETEGTR